jgi:hypothetical protein
MRITESRLRRIIRQVISESIEEYSADEEFSPAEQEYIDMGLFDANGELRISKKNGPGHLVIRVTDPIGYREDPRASIEMPGADLPSIHDQKGSNLPSWLAP